MMNRLPLMSLRLAAILILFPLIGCFGESDDNPTDPGDGGGGTDFGDTLSPASDAEISGDHEFDVVMIPAGVTLTATGDVSMKSSGPVTIAGTIVGPGMGISIEGDTIITIAGTIDNSLDSLSTMEGGEITIVGQSDIMIDSATIAGSGDITIRNDTTLSTGSKRAADSGDIRLSGDIYTNSFLSRDGADGQEGTDGRPGFSLFFKAARDLKLEGVSLTASQGGKGGAGRHSVTSGPANAKGGPGAVGGHVGLEAANLVACTMASRILTGEGGDGGTARADAGPVPGAPTGSEAMATGGNGGDPGRAWFTSEIGSYDGLELVSVFLGDGGKGGWAAAYAGDGVHESDAKRGAATQETSPGGGHATARAGNGGSIPSTAVVVLNAKNERPAISGNWRPGGGGDAIASAGNGAPGKDVVCPHGGIGGNGFAHGGKGGSCLFLDPATNEPAFDGADGGDMFASRGNGGRGWDGCQGAEPAPGGFGGDGGSVFGEVGAAGSGREDGVAGSIELEECGNGGEAGPGVPPGDGGAAGLRAYDAESAVATSESLPVFSSGPDGSICISDFPMCFTAALSVVKDATNPHDPFIFQADQQPDNELIIVVNVTLVDGGGGKRGDVVQISSDFPWVPVTGTLGENGEITAAGNGTVAGFQNVEVVFDGTIFGGEIDGIYSMGTQGGLPGGEQIDYGLTGVDKGAAP